MGHSGLSHRPAAQLGLQRLRVLHRPKADGAPQRREEAAPRRGGGGRYGGGESSRCEDHSSQLPAKGHRASTVQTPPRQKQYHSKPSPLVIRRARRGLWLRLLLRVRSRGNLFLGGQRAEDGGLGGLVWRGPAAASAPGTRSGGVGTPAIKAMESGVPASWRRMSGAGPRPSAKWPKHGGVASPR